MSSVSFNAALNAYNNAAKMKPQMSSGGAGGSESIFATAIGSGVQNTISALGNVEKTVAKSLVKQADITDVVTAVTNAELTLKAVVEVRDRLIAAHQEIMKMPI